MLQLDLIPYGLEVDRPVPSDNPLTPAKVDLGRKLFFDPILSADGSVACASCHDPSRGLAGSEPLSVGVGGRRGRRNAPSLFNTVYRSSFFWDGRTDSLEKQVLFPLVHAAELANTSVDVVVARLRSHTDYRERFAATFADGVTGENLARAIASFERVLLHGDSRVDRFHAANVDALDESERQGLWLFTSRGKCWRCHSGANYSDERFHNTGVSWGKEPIDLGRYEITAVARDKGAFKTPSLRGVADTAPYMHDGSLATLEAVVEFYNQGGVKNQHLDAMIAPLDLSKSEIGYLVAFLRALSGTHSAH